MDFHEHADEQQRLKDEAVKDEPEAQGRAPVAGEELPDAYDSAKVLAADRKPLDGPDEQTGKFATEPAPMINTRPPISFATGGIEDTLAAPPAPEHEGHWADAAVHELERLLEAVKTTGSLMSGSYVAVKNAAENTINGWWAWKAQKESSTNSKQAQQEQDAKRIGHE